MPPSNNKSMMMNTRPGRIGDDSDESKMPVTSMMMNNHASDVADSDLMDLFAQYGALNNVTFYSSHSYTFIFFKRIEVAKAAKDTLQGVDLHGHPIKSESDSEAGTGSGGAEEEESGSKIGRQEPGRARPRSRTSPTWMSHREWWDRGVSRQRRNGVFEIVFFDCWVAGSLRLCSFGCWVADFHVL